MQYLYRTKRFRGVTESFALPSCFTMIGSSGDYPGPYDKFRTLQNEVAEIGTGHRPAVVMFQILDALKDEVHRRR